MVSVIIPVYNKQSSIIQSLNSVLEQTYKDFEVIVIDDGSTDKTATLLEPFRESITYLYQDNQGQGAARNLGLENAQGDYISFLDADDYWEPEFLETCISFLSKYPRAVAVNTAQKTYHTKKHFVISPKELMEINPTIIDNFFQVWAQHDHIRTGTVVIRKSIIDKIGGQRSNLRISQDLEYWALIATYGKWGFIPTPLWVGNSRVHAKKNGWTKKYSERRKLCPDIEEWEERILPRLQPDDIEPFEVVKGKVALNFTHNKILGGHENGAENIIRKYGHLFPETKLSYLILKGYKNGRFFWQVVIRLIKLRERLKDL